MVDRLASYPMMSNFNPTMLQHQQQQQQRQQPQPQDSMANFQNPNPMWSQMHHLQNQFLPGNGSDINNSQMSQQMVDFLRNQRATQQQQQQQQQQQPFGIGMPGPSGQQPFHDQPNQQLNASQMASGFTTTPLSNSSIHGQLNGRMVNPFQNNASTGTSVSRQYEMLANQNQNQRLQQQTGLSGQTSIPQISQPDMFPLSNDSIRRPSPQPPQQLRGIPNQQSDVNMASGASSRPPQLTHQQLKQLQQKVKELEEAIAMLEAQHNLLERGRGNLSEALFVARIRVIEDDLARKRENYTKMTRILNFITSARNSANPMSSPQSQPNVMQNQQPWMNQQGVAQSSQFGLVQNPSQNPQSNPSQHAQLNSLLSSANRSALHPHQPFPGNMPFAMHSAPTAAAGGAIQIPGSQTFASQLLVNMMNQVPAPLEKSHFDGLYKSFCASKQLVVNPVTVENRPIDLHLLHTIVMQEGGMVKVGNSDSWATVAGRMGFVQFPGGDTEGPKSGPATAELIANIYKMYLAEFDANYIKTITEARQRQHLLPTRDQLASGQVTPTGAQLNALMQLANSKLPELRNQNFSEKMVRFIDQNRANIIRNLMEQRPQGGLQSSQVQPRNNGLPSAQFANSPPKNSESQNTPHLLQGRVSGSLADTAENRLPQARSSDPQLLQSAMQQIALLKQEISHRQLPQMRNYEVPSTLRFEYNNLVEKLHRAAMEVDQKLPMFFALVKDRDQIRKLLAIIVSAQHQRQMLSANPPRFIMNIEILKTMLFQIQQANDQFSSLQAKVQQAQASHAAQNTAPVTTGTMQQHSVSHNSPPQPSSSQPSPQSVSQAPSRPVVPIKQQLPAKKPAPAQTPIAKTPTPPPPAASTPVASASTPTLAPSTPPTPKSPKTKAAPRKASTAAKSRRPSTVAPKASPDAAPSPSNGNKRPREEEDGPSPNNVTTPEATASEPSPPKRPKTEWEGPLSEALKKKNEVVENAAKTEESAAAFFEQMSDYLRAAIHNEGPESTLASDLTNTLDELLKGCGAIPDPPDPSLALLELPDPNIHSAISSSTDEIGQFFDFSSYVGYDDDDSDSKAPTPDLIPSSSTNPSPESDADSSPFSMDTKCSDTVDPLHLGTLKEIDGGESAYYHTNQFKYDGPMPILEQPWAIFTR